MRSPAPQQYLPRTLINGFLEAFNDDSLTQLGFRAVIGVEAPYLAELKSSLLE